MIRITRDFDSAVFREKPLILYGYGKWGKSCLRYLKDQEIAVDAICDRKYRDYQEIYENMTFISPEQLQDKKDATIVIALENYNDIILWLSGFVKQIFVFHNDDQVIYQIETNYEILGCKTNQELQTLLSDKKKIALVGTLKHREDFKYIFRDIKVNSEYEKWNDISEDYDLVILGESSKAPEEERVGNVVEARDLFTLLTGNRCGNIKPYMMMLQTYFAHMVDQPFCSRPFTNAVINSNCEFHFCCGDWSLGIKNILEQPDLQSIWDSTEAKIYRLSIINRTYCFCKWERCVYCQANPERSENLNRYAGTAKQIPDSLEIGIDKTCNLFCRSCRDCVIVEKGKRKENIEKAKDIIEASAWLETCNTILLGGQGEVFFSPVYRNLMYPENGRRETLDLRTNGVLLTEEEFDKLRGVYHTLKIIVSVDAAAKSTYDKLRRSNDIWAWEKLTENLKMLSVKRAGGMLEFFQINMCVQKENYAEIPDFIEMGATLGVDKIYLTPIRNWGTYSEEEFKEISIFTENKQLKPEVKNVT